MTPVTPQAYYYLKTNVFKFYFLTPKNVNKYKIEYSRSIYERKDSYKYNLMYGSRYRKYDTDLVLKILAPCSPLTCKT